MKTLVTGGNGLIGRYAVDRLVRSGHIVTSLSKARLDEHTNPALNRAALNVVGDAGDPAILADLMQGVDAVLHLAANPSPYGMTAAELLRANSVTTLAVLESAADSGVRGVVYASSISMLGLVFGDGRVPGPARLPVDEGAAPTPADAYALSKLVDEASAQMAARRWELSSVALRFPYTQTASAIAERAHDPSQLESFARELWAYLDVLDAAEACERALVRIADGTISGAHAVYLAADDVILPGTSLDELVRQHYPELADGLVGRRGAYDTSRAESLLGFRAHRLLRAS